MLIVVPDGEIAVPCNLQSAAAGFDSRPEAEIRKAGAQQAALTIGSRAIGCREPCQILTEAALSGLDGVPRGYPIRACF